MLNPATIKRLLSPWGSSEQLRVDRSAVYRFHATVAETFRDGSVFLVGDAAHQMPPFNGQGMCTGMRDAENLSWKLAAVAKGCAGATLLDTYDEERRPHAAAQVEHSVDSGRLIQAIAHDGDIALEKGYGQRRFPSQRGRLFIGDHPIIGRPLPAANTPVDLPTDGWLLIGSDLEAHDLEPWNDLDAHPVAVPPDAYPGLIDDKATIVARPDRSVAAITDDPRAIGMAVASHLASSC